MRQLTKLLRCERGANAIEYALVASLISIAAIGAYSHLGEQGRRHAQQRVEPHELIGTFHGH